MDPLAERSIVQDLRALTRAQLDEYLTQAQCMIVSERHAPAFDAYVLSESSLFVYSTKLVIKTCGTTALLVATPRLLELAAALGLAVRRCKYTRACFKYPKLQVRADPAAVRLVSRATPAAPPRKRGSSCGSLDTAAAAACATPAATAVWLGQLHRQPGLCPPLTVRRCRTRAPAAVPPPFLA
jgi:hypothetical protein